MADLLRLIAMTLGTLVMGAGVAAGFRRRRLWKETRDRFHFYLAFAGFGSAGGSAWVVADIADRLGTPLSWRTPTAIALFVVVLIGIMGVALDSRHGWG